MNVLIIEDEINLSKQLQRLIHEIDPQINIIDSVESIERAVFTINESRNIDLMFVDIYLSDGLSFEIFDIIQTRIPVIFCTAYDKYALKAFELDSIDYLLKPIRKGELEKAINKFKRMFSNSAGPEDFPKLAETIKNLYRHIEKGRNYKRNFLLPFKDRLIPVNVDDISYFQLDHGVVKCTTYNQRFFPMDISLDSLMDQLNPEQFHRANRQFIINRKSIKEVQYYFNGKLFLNVNPEPSESIVVSKAKAADFKQWMNQL